MNQAWSQSGRWVISSLLLALGGCTKTDLDRQTAMKLLQGKGTVVVGSFQAYVSYAQNSGASGWYQQLIKAGVISCGTGPVCQPGKSANGLQQDFTNFNFQAGTLVPAEVTGVTQTGPNSAVAQVRLQFQASPLYAQYRAALDHLTAEAQVMGGGPIQAQTQRNAAEAAFQRYDDGWRIQSFSLAAQMASPQLDEVPSSGPQKDVLWSNLNLALNARANSILGLGEIVKTYAKRPTDQHTLALVDDARAAVLAASIPKDKLQADLRLDRALSDLSIIVEGSQALKSNAAFIKLEDEIAGQDNQIAVAKRAYLEVVPGDAPKDDVKKVIPKVKF